jgi:tRNA pseudouridine38-40 synthase
LPLHELGGAGRTDAGVHALAQVAHLRLQTTSPATPDHLQHAINAQLPADINIRSIEPADPRFHARHHAISRSYLYQISRRRTAFAKRYVWWVDSSLDLDLMRTAATSCTGEHDFTSFCDPRTDPTDARIRLDRIEIAQHGALTLIRYEASHFAWRMVRRLTGALVEVGRKQVSVAAFTELLDIHSPPDPNPTSAWTAPASGLFLESVRYVHDPPLPTWAPAFPIAH